VSLPAFATAEVDIAGDAKGVFSPRTILD